MENSRKHVRLSLVIDFDSLEWKNVFKRRFDHVRNSAMYNNWSASITGPNTVNRCLIGPLNSLFGSFDCPSRYLCYSLSETNVTPWLLYLILKVIGCPFKCIFVVHGCVSPILARKVLFSKVYLLSIAFAMLLNILVPFYYACSIWLLR